tara:strand:- start:170 stop:385 length:216 start_codon:yes stop_codon:yes gene_type:complete
MSISNFKIKKGFQMNNNQKKACLFCVLAFLLGTLLVSSGCRNTRRAVRIQPPIGAQLDIELQPPVVDLGKR